MQENLRSIGIDLCPSGESQALRSSPERRATLNCSTNHVPKRNLFWLEIGFQLWAGALHNFCSSSRKDDTSMGVTKGEHAVFRPTMEANEIQHKPTDGGTMGIDGV